MFHDPTHAFSTLAAVTRQLEAMKRRHDAERREAEAELVQATEACTQILKHTAEPCVRLGGLRFELGPRGINLYDHDNIPEVHDLAMPPHLLPAPEAEE